MQTRDERPHEQPLCVPVLGPLMQAARDGNDFSRSRHPPLDGVLHRGACVPGQRPCEECAPRWLRGGQSVPSCLTTASNGTTCLFLACARANRCAVQARGRAPRKKVHPCLKHALVAVAGLVRAHLPPEERQLQPRKVGRVHGAEHRVAGQKVRQGGCGPEGEQVVGQLLVLAWAVIRQLRKERGERGVGSGLRVLSHVRAVHRLLDRGVREDEQPRLRLHHLAQRVQEVADGAALHPKQLQQLSFLQALAGRAQENERGLDQVPPLARGWGWLARQRLECPLLWRG